MSRRGVPLAVALNRQWLQRPLASEASRQWYPRSLHKRRQLRRTDKPVRCLYRTLLRRGSKLDELKSQNTHYIPEWLLKKFRHPTLLELDIFTGRVAQRNPKKAASAQDLWPEDIEDGLSVFDNQAAQIYRKRIEGRQQIILLDAERMDFAHWLAQFAVRVPTIRADLRKQLEDGKENPQIIRRVVLNNRTELLRAIRENSPGLFDETVNEFGKAETEEFLLAQVAQKFAESNSIWPSHEQIHHQYMRNNRSEDFAKRFLKYQWSWIRSREAFVIGDNPLVRWHEKSQRWNYGINKNDVEITIPLGHDLCLRLDKRYRKNADRLMNCSNSQTRIYNERQRLAAIKYVYGNSHDALDFINKPIIGWHPKSAE